MSIKFDTKRFTNIQMSNKWKLVTKNSKMWKFVLIIQLILHWFCLFIEPISCSIPALPRNARYLHLRPFMQKIPDGNHLEYICENSQHRQRILCRRGKIFPKNPICYNGKNFIKLNSNQKILSSRLSCQQSKCHIFKKFVSSSRTCLLYM